MQLVDTKPCVLLVEDDEVSAFLSLRVINDAELFSRVDWVRDGAEALACKLSAYAFVFLDLSLPHIDGLAFLDSFHKNTSIPPGEWPNIIVLSGAESGCVEVERAQSFSSVRGVISKPLSPVHLSDLLVKAIR